MLETSLITVTRDHFDRRDRRMPTHFILPPEARNNSIVACFEVKTITSKTSFSPTSRIHRRHATSRRCIFRFHLKRGTIKSTRRDICSKIPACSTFFFSFGGGHDGSLRVQLEREEREKKMIPRDGTVTPISANLWASYSFYTFKVEPVTFLQMRFCQSVDDDVESLGGLGSKQEAALAIVASC